MYSEKMRAVVLTAIIALLVLAPTMYAANASDTLYQQEQANIEGNITDVWSFLPRQANESLDICQSKTGEEQPTARIVWEYREKPDFYSRGGADADRLPNGNTLISDTENGRIIEVTSEGEKVWEVFFENWGMYRSERISDLDLSRTKLYNSSGYPTLYNITVNIWDSNKTCDGITFADAWGYLWGINMTGHAIWRYKGLWLETKVVGDNHLLLLGMEDLFSPAEVREIDFDGNIIFSKKQKHTHHDVLKLKKDIIIYLFRIFKFTTDNKLIMGDEIRMKYLPLNWVFWRWNTFDYLPLEHNCSECMKVLGDWTHSNSLTLMMEGDMPVLYLSVRNLNQIVKINCATKEIIWKLGEHGDFKMYEMDGTEVTKLFSHQHDPEILPNGNILLFDNGLHRGTETNYSRVIEIELTS